jgi:hypothetical protein
MMSKFYVLDEDEKEQVLGHVGQFFLTLITGIVNCEPICNSQNEAVYDSAAPVLPKALALLKPTAFGVYFNQQKNRLDHAWTPAKVGLVESEQRELRAAYRSEVPFKDAMDALPDTVDFNIAWGTQLAGARFPTLLEFAGGLASVHSRQPQRPSLTSP